jgi:hypothetical protein
VAVDKAHVTCINCQEKGHYANKCTKPKKDKTATNNMAMFVGVAGVAIEKPIVCATAISGSGSRSILDTFFDDWADDSWDEEHGFDDVGEFQPIYADSNTSEDPVMVELEELPYAVAEEESELPPSTSSQLRRNLSDRSESTVTKAGFWTQEQLVESRMTKAT